MPHELQSPELQAWAAGFPLVLLHSGVTLLILVAGAALYALITPHREIQLIRDGNSAAAVAFGGMLLALSIPLAVVLASSHSLLDIALWGVATLFVQLLVFRLTDFILHGLPQRIQEGEMAAAAILVCAKVAAALILAASVSAV
jgi:putative membrane protein